MNKSDLRMNTLKSVLRSSTINPYTKQVAPTIGAQSCFDRRHTAS